MQQLYCILIGCVSYGMICNIKFTSQVTCSRPAVASSPVSIPTESCHAIIFLDICLECIWLKVYDYYCKHCIIWVQTCHSLFLSVHCACRPAGIPVVPVYEEDEPNTRRKVQRITSPEKWELKQVNIHCEKKTNTRILEKLVTHVQVRCNDSYVSETSPHSSSALHRRMFSRFETFSEFRFLYLLFTRLYQSFDFAATKFQAEFFKSCS